MFSTGRFRATLLAAAVAVGGCSSTGGQLGTLQTQNRSLLEQNKAQLAEIENLKTHSRLVEDKLIDAERQLAAQERDGKPGRQRLATGDRETKSSVFDPSGDEHEEGASSADARSDRRR